jgi:LacI family transcriptional regulator
MTDQPTRPQKPARAATLADVGREAGVSAMAASAVLNGAKTSSRISDETRALVLAAAERLRYRPNATARGLAGQRMNTIGVATTLSRNELNQYFLEVFNGVIEGAAETGQNTTVFTLAGWDEAPQRMQAICDGRIDGVILLAPLIELAAAAELPDHTPFVSVHANHQLPGVVNLESDEEVGAYQMVRHMLALGHRRILHIAGPADSIGARRRVEGWLRAHADAGVTPPPDHVLHGEFAIESGRRLLDAWMTRHGGEDLPHAIFGGSDAIAFGCLETLATRGLRTPADISVVGFDDTLLARSARLATVRQPLREMGHRAVRLLVAHIDARHQQVAYRAPANLVLPTEVVPGQSLAPPRTTAIPMT